MCFDSFPLFDLVEVCPEFAALVSMSCPCDSAAAVPLLPVLQLPVATRAALEVVVAAEEYPIDRLALHLGPFVVLALVVVQMRSRIGRA